MDDSFKQLVNDIGMLLVFTYSKLKINFINELYFTNDENRWRYQEQKERFKIEFRLWISNFVTIIITE